jgi:DNA modification methylase
MLRKPSDLGYDDNKFTLPELIIHEIIVPVSLSESNGGLLFRMPAETLQGRQKERRLTINKRVTACVELINGDKTPWLIWCNLNNESEALKSAIKDSVEVKGTDKREYKESIMLGFSEGTVKKLITKPKIAGFGMNWQHCSNIAFVGLSDSYEQFYQAVRRCWRFGQKKKVNCYIITAETEGAVVDNIKRKEKNANNMAKEMVKHMHVLNEENIKCKKQKKAKYKTQVYQGNGWEARLGDCIDYVGAIEENSIHYSIFSPPFADLYTYSDSNRDMGNNKGDADFFMHFAYLIKELYRVLMPGRLVSIHCMNLPTSKTHHGYIGIRDFRGDIIREFQRWDFIYHSEVCIWKDPVVAVTRTKALGLLHKQMVKDSSKSRQGIPDYLITMRKPGENPEPVQGELNRFVGDKNTFERRGKLSIDIWQKYASPVWMDINPSNTLQKTSAREHKDEKHICPLQLDVIERAVQLWTNTNDLILSPFMGIGSEGYIAIKTGRRFIGIELKESYYRQAVKNLEAAKREYGTEQLFYSK